MERKYKTYNWNFEVNLQEEAIRFEAIKECFSDSMKDQSLALAGAGEDLNASNAQDKDNSGPNHVGSREVYVRPLDETFDPFHDGSAAIGKDGSMVLMKNTNIIPSQNITNFNIHVHARPINMIG